MNNPNYNGTLSPRISLYHSDGKGRDSYIYNNNGGFYKQARIINTGGEYGPFNFAKYYSLKNDRSLNFYHSDGSGRDSYVIHSPHAMKTYIANVKLPNILRNPNFDMSPDANRKVNVYTIKERAAYKERRKKQHELIERVFYGKGSSPRRCSPRVRLCRESPKMTKSEMNVVPKAYASENNSNLLTSIDEDNLRKSIMNILEYESKKC